METVPPALLDVNETLVDPGPFAWCLLAGWAMRASSASRVNDAARRITACNLEASRRPAYSPHPRPPLTDVTMLSGSVPSAYPHNPVHPTRS